jgi:demethylmenaquinone methyltransferase/2-methoxy-6-polyprenyl-1,4-benzoquinol methylase
MPSDDVLPAARDKAPFVREMFDRIAPSYDRVNRVMTFGLDLSWRRRLVDALGLPVGARVLDLACGTGDLLTILARRGMRPVGLDLSIGMLSEVGRAVPLVQGVGEHLPFAQASFDAVTCGFAVRNFADLAQVLSEVARVLRPGGGFGILEVAVPERRTVRALHGLYFQRIVPRIGAALSSDRRAYAYLPRSVVYLPTPAELAVALERAGFLSPRRVVVGLGAAQLVVATRGGA